MQISIRESSYTRKKIRYSQPIRVVDTFLYEREMALLCFTDKNNNSFTGELSPIDHFHPFDLNDSLKEFNSFTFNHLNLEIFDLTKPFFNLLSFKTKNPSLLFAIESILLKMLFKYKKKDLNHYFRVIKKINSATLQKLPLLSMASDVVKLKIRPETIDKDSESINKIPHNIRLRLDGNCKFNTISLQELLNKITHPNIEFLEDPLEDINDWSEIKTKIPFAIDENLLSDLSTEVTYWILKPTLLGLSKCFELATSSFSLKKQLILSGTFESSHSNIIYDYLSSFKMISPKIVHGLGTKDFLLDANFPLTSFFLDSFSQKINGHKSYLNFKIEIEKLSYSFSHLKNQTVILQFQSNYKLITTMLALWHVDALPVIIFKESTQKEIKIITVQTNSTAHLTDSDYILSKNKIPMRDFSLNHISLVLMTSGSSGVPKPIYYNLKNIYYSALGSIEFYAMNQSSISSITLPLNHIGGMMTFFRSLITKSTIFFDKSISESLDLPITTLSLVPTQLIANIDNKKLKKVKSVIIGGAALPDYLYQKALDQNIKISKSYGMSETTAQISATFPGEISRSSGHILNYRNAEVRENKISISGPTIASYSKTPVNSVLSSDLGTISDGQIYIHSREDRTFISGGENVSCSEIESEISKIDKIESCQILPVKSKHFGHVGLCFYNGELSTKKIKNILSKNISKYKIPKFFFKLKIKTKRLKPSLHLTQKLAECVSNYIYPPHEYSESKTNILFVHGFMGESSEWAYFTENLKGKYNCFTVDLPGHGKNISTFENKEEYFRIINPILKSLSPFTGYGYSLGGRVILDLFKIDRDIFTYIFLESVHSGLDTLEEKEKRISSDKNLLMKTETDFEKNIFLQQWYDNSMWGNIKDHSNFTSMILKKINFSNWKGWQLALNLFSIGKQENHKVLINNLKHATLLSGEKDNKYQKLNSLFQSSNPSINILCIKDSGHNVHLEKNDEILAIINSIS